MKYEIKYKELSEYLKTLKETDFQRADGHPARNPNGVIKKGYAMDDIEFFKKDLAKIPSEQIIDFGMPFLVDILGNDLSVVFLTKKKYRMPTGRLVRAKFNGTVVDDCRETYGTPLNGYWIIPERFITKIKK